MHILHISLHILHILVIYCIFCNILCIAYYIFCIFFSIFCISNCIFLTIMHIMQWIRSKAGLHRFNSIAQHNWDWRGPGHGQRGGAGWTPHRPAAAASPFPPPPTRSSHERRLQREAAGPLAEGHRAGQRGGARRVRRIALLARAILRCNKGNFL